MQRDELVAVEWQCGGSVSPASEGMMGIGITAFVQAAACAYIEATLADTSSQLRRKEIVMEKIGDAIGLAISMERVDSIGRAS